MSHVFVLFLFSCSVFPDCFVFGSIQFLSSHSFSACFLEKSHEKLSVLWSNGSLSLSLSLFSASFFVFFYFSNISLSLCDLRRLSYVTRFFRRFICFYRRQNLAFELDEVFICRTCRTNQSSATNDKKN